MGSFNAYLISKTISKTLKPNVSQGCIDGP